MTDAMDATARIPSSVERVEPNEWHAWPKSASASGVQGTGSTKGKAIADLERNIAWVAHFSGLATIECDFGRHYVVTTDPHHGCWNVFRVGSSAGECFSLYHAESFSELTRILKEKE